MFTVTMAIHGPIELIFELEGAAWGQGRFALAV